MASVYEDIESSEKGSESALTSSLLDTSPRKNGGEVRPLIPVIMLHGLAGSRTSQSGSCRDLASHGYIVFSIDHNDGSAYYSRKNEGSEQYWPLEQDLLDIDYRRKQLDIRQAEVKEMIDDMQSATFL